MDFKSLLAEFKQSAVTKKSKQNINKNTNVLRSSDYYQSAITADTNNITNISSNDNNAESTPPKNTNPVETIYIVCPPPHKVTTGGPEALHQLCDIINRFTFLPAYMLYISPPYNFTPISTSSTAYTHYNAPCQTNIISPESNSLCIWPECWTKYAVRRSSNNNDNNDFCSDCHLAIWWLSVNNNDGFQNWNDTSILHLYQSEYAKQYLLQHVVQKNNIIALKEYIPTYNSDDDSSTLDKEETTETNIIRSMDIVYNPKKGMHYTDQIIDILSNQYSIKPIGHPNPLTSIEVRQFLSNSKIYIDFGPHPGMDRLPREAALCGCLVVTNKEGAAKFDQDVPIPKQYKSDKFDVQEVCKLLKSSLEGYEDRKGDFEEYRKWIGGQFDEMKDYVTDFVKILDARFGDSDDTNKEEAHHDETEDEVLTKKRKVCENVNDDDDYYSLM